MPAYCGAVFCGASDGNLEFAWQKCKLWMQGTPLPQNFCIGPWVDHFIDGHASQFVGGDVANAIAAGLNAMHVHGGQKVHHIGRLVQGNPVELNILPGGEVTVTFDEAG